MTKHYVKIPKDLGEIKQKFIFGLTKRQAICFGIGFAIGIPVFFLTKGIMGQSGGIAMMGIVASPALICGMYKKNGLYFETYIKYMFMYFKSPRIRTYKSVNAYVCLENQIEYSRLNRLLIKYERSKK